MRVRGLEHREMDIWERMGTRMLAQAVLEATSVRKVETKATESYLAQEHRSLHPKNMLLLI